MSIPTLTVNEILGRYYYKEWIKDELKDIGENTNGDKDDLICRFLQSNAIRSSTVNQVAQGLISSLRKTDLKQILRDHDLTIGKTKEELLNKVLNSFNFEPYVRFVNRYCNVCKSETEQELHFDDDWNANYFKCTVCSSDLPANKDGENTVSKEIKTNDNTSDIMKYLKLHYWHIIPLFLALLMGLGIKYGWITGLVISLLITIFIVYMSFLLIERRQGIKQP